MDKNLTIKKAIQLLEKLTGKKVTLVEKPLNELDINTYAKVMDDTESYPVTINNGNKELGNKRGRVNNLAKDAFKKEWEKRYLQTPITFIGKSGREYTYPVVAMKFNTNYTNFDIILKNDNYENGIDGTTLIWIKNPLYIDNLNKEKIANEPVKLQPQSEAKIREMFKFGLSAQHADKGGL